jgi:hypothetical protein
LIESTLWCVDQPSSQFDFPEQQINEVDFVEGAGAGVANSLNFEHGQGDAITSTRVKIRGLPG